MKERIHLCRCCSLPRWMKDERDEFDVTGSDHELDPVEFKVAGSVYPDEFLKAHLSDKVDKSFLPTEKDIVKKHIGDTCGVGIFTCPPFQRGEVIASFVGEHSTKVLQHTLQRGGKDDHLLDPYFIGFLVHSCNPNAVLDMHQQKVYCLQNIGTDELISIDYAVTEDDLFVQFKCVCESPNCREWVAGRCQVIEMN